MADADVEPQFNTLAERIAALNKQKNFNSNGTNGVNGANGIAAAKKKPPPPPPPGGAKPSAPKPLALTEGPSPLASPPLPSRPNKQTPPALPRRDTQTSQVDSPTQNGNDDVRPPLPTRKTSTQPSPLMPPRRPSAQLTVSNGRRGSASSEFSQLSGVSSTSTGSRKLPPAFNQATLPPLPPTRREREAQAAAENGASRPAAPSRTTSSISQRSTASTARPGLPPRLPSRAASSQNQTQSDTQESNEPPRALPSRTRAPLGIQGFGTSQKKTPAGQQNGDDEKPPPMPQRRTANDEPPPVPLSSRPTMKQIEEAQSRPAPAPQAQNDCWVCRDWSGPDNVAAQFPRQSLPRNDPVGHLARGLCDPFPSYTDKARAIFTWFHHNIFYDTVSFFNNDVRPMTVEDTIFSGKAVCQGYADTYKAIANKAGLECVVVGGHGKGFGYTPLKKGERPPPAKPDGHAWNAVRIDGGEWKLLDACWGAGHICGNNNLYKQEFSPDEFIAPNDKFGRRHFPQNPQYQFRNDGRTITWEEYYRGRVEGPTPTFYTSAKTEGFAEDSLEPKERDIPVNSGQIVRFQFSKICEHWTCEKAGLAKPPLLLLNIHGVDGRKDDMVPIETDGYWHWVDVHARDLGAPGQSVQVNQLTTMNGQDARGATAQEFLSKKGKTSMSWSGVMKWELV